MAGGSMAREGVDTRAGRQFRPWQCESATEDATRRRRKNATLARDSFVSLPFCMGDRGSSARPVKPSLGVAGAGTPHMGSGEQPFPSRQPDRRADRSPSRRTIVDRSQPRGGMGERLIPAVLKTVVPERVPGVRIPLPPPRLHRAEARGKLAQGLRWSLIGESLR
jgi:hypothetical protein